MEARRLRYFIAVAEHLNFSRAAEALHISQPPLSQQIHKLEKAVGIQLLDRSRHHVKLTVGGRVYLDWARKIVGDIECAQLFAQRAHRGQTGRLVVGFMHSAPLDLLPRLLRHFSLSFPEVQLELQEMPKLEQLTALREGRIDVALLRPPIIDDALGTLTICRERLLIALPKHHAFARRRTLKLSMLSKQPFIGYSAAFTVLNGVILQACRQAGFTPHVVQESIQLHTIITLVSAGIGVAIVPASAKKLQLDDVVYKELQDVKIRTEIVLAWHLNYLSPVTLKFIELAKQLHRQTREDPL